jgi:hypothetical protein
MTDEEFLKRYSALESDACQARGHIIHRVTHLEMSINIFLANYFAKNADISNELLSYLFCTNRITFENKNQIFYLVVEKHYPDFVKARPNFKDELGKIAKIRNEFAHSFIDVTDSGIMKKDIVALAKWKGDKVLINNYTKKQINEFIDFLYSYTEDVQKLI